MMTEAEPPIRISVADEVFEIRASLPTSRVLLRVDLRPQPRSRIRLSVSSDRPLTINDHEEAIRNFVRQVNPETGYIE